MLCRIDGKEPFALTKEELQASLATRNLHVMGSLDECRDRLADFFSHQKVDAQPAEAGRGGDAGAQKKVRSFPHLYTVLGEFVPCLSGVYG